MILQMITFFAVLFGVAGYTIYDVTNEAGGGRTSEGDGVTERGGGSE